MCELLIWFGWVVCELFVVNLRWISACIRPVRAIGLSLRFYAVQSVVSAL